MAAVKCPNCHCEFIAAPDSDVDSDGPGEWLDGSSASSSVDDDSLSSDGDDGWASADDLGSSSAADSSAASDASDAEADARRPAQLQQGPTLDDSPPAWAHRRMIKRRLVESDDSDDEDEPAYRRSRLDALKRRRLAKAVH